MSVPAPRRLFSEADDLVEAFSQRRTLGAIQTSIQAPCFTIVRELHESDIGLVKRSQQVAVRLERQVGDMIWRYIVAVQHTASVCQSLP